MSAAPTVGFALLAVVCLLLAPSGCVRTPASSGVSSPHPVAGGPPAFEVRTFERSLGDCGAEGEGACARFLARYPVITGGVRPPVQEELNRSLVESVARGVLLDEPEAAEAPDTLVEAADELLSRWRRLRTEPPPESMGPASWSDERRMDVIYADHRVLSVELALYSYTGGAHPNTFVHLASYDLATGGPLALEDLLPAGAEARLEDLGERAFRVQRKVPEGESLEAAGFWFEDGRFRLNDNFAVTGAGLTFVFNPYEVGPYAIGPTRITVPWGDIAELLRPEAPVIPAAAGAAPPPRA